MRPTDQHRSPVIRGRRRYTGLALAGLAAVALTPAVASSSSGQPPASSSSAAAPSLPLEADGTLSIGKGFKGVLKRHRGTQVKLSNEAGITRWAFAQRALTVRAAPNTSAGKITRLRFASNQHARQVYIWLQGVADTKGRIWLQVRVPGRPNGRVGWVQSSGFYHPSVNRLQLIVDRGTLRTTLFRDGQKVFSAPVGVGTPSTPTPGGHFVIEKKNGPIFGPVFGTHVLFTNAFSSLEDWPGGGLVGMHGTNEPSLVPGRPSHGCIRLHNADINRLYGLIRVGTPLWIK